jgi:hypothetical protein
MSVSKRLATAACITIGVLVALSLVYMATGVGMVDLLAHPGIVLIVFLVAFVVAPRVSAWLSERRSK